MKTADQYRAEAQQAEQRRQDSIDRNGGDIDSNNCLTTWAHDLTAQLARTQAALVDAGGVATFRGLYDRATGQRVRARFVYRESRPWAGEYGSFWQFCDEHDRPVGRFLSDSKGGPRSRMYREGFEVREELAPAEARLASSGTGLSGNCWVQTFRTDEGYPKDAVVRR